MIFIAGWVTQILSLDECEVRWNDLGRFVPTSNKIQTNDLTVNLQIGERIVIKGWDTKSWYSQKYYQDKIAKYKDMHGTVVDGAYPCGCHEVLIQLDNGTLLRSDSCYQSYLDWE